MTPDQIIHYDDQTLLNLFSAAVQRTWDEEGDLLARRVSERAVTHRIALHLQTFFPQHTVDCEYNRNHEASKTIEVRLARVGEQKRRELIQRAVDAGMPRNEAEQQVVVSTNPLPDLIVHRRRSNDHNLFIAEIKVAGDSRGAAGRLYDLEKLRAFTAPEPYGYRLGVFADIAETFAELTVVQHDRDMFTHRLPRRERPGDRS